jgi:hypothetical protein
MKGKHFTVAAAAVVLAIAAGPLQAACVNKYVARTDGNKKILTLLTGKLTFPEAQELAKAITAKAAPPIEWVDEGGKTIASSVQVQAVRPMPVACDDKPSGSVINVTFLTFSAPSGGVTIKFSEELLVYFDEQEK